MFNVDGVNVLLRKVTLRIDKDDDDEQVRACDCTFRVPVLDWTLADQIRLGITQHCFGKDKLPLWGIHEVKFQPPEDRYTVTLQQAPDVELATLELATLERVRVWRVNDERRDLSLEFVTRHQLQRGDAKDLAALLTAWEVGSLQLSLLTVQIPLGFSEADDASTPKASTRRGMH